MRKRCFKMILKATAKNLFLKNDLVKQSLNKTERVRSKVITVTFSFAHAV